MFKWRRRRSKGNQADRDLAKTARVLEEAESGDFLGLHSRRSGSSDPEGDGAPDGGISHDSPSESPDPSQNGDSD